MCGAALKAFAASCAAAFSFGVCELLTMRALGQRQLWPLAFAGLTFLLAVANLAIVVVAVAAVGQDLDWWCCCCCYWPQLCAPQMPLAMEAQKKLTNCKIHLRYSQKKKDKQKKRNEAKQQTRARATQSWLGKTAVFRCAGP